MSKLVLVRHGQSEFNAGLTRQFNSGVTPKGIIQANNAGMILRDLVDKSYIGYVSPYHRCLQTALTIIGYTDVTFKVCHLVGEKPEKIHLQSSFVSNSVLSYPDFDWTGCAGYDYSNESDERYQTRLSDFVKMLEPDKNYLVISHMTPIADLIRKITGETKEITIPNCSISLIEDGKPVFIGRES